MNTINYSLITPSDGLNLLALRRANIARLPEFRNSKGEIAHTQMDGSDWSLGEWMCALVGEVGEAANIIKKVRRGDLTAYDAHYALSKEFADILIYLDILAYQVGIDLSQATIDKFNEVSERVRSCARL